MRIDIGGGSEAAKVFPQSPSSPGTEGRPLLRESASPVSRPLLSNDLRSSNFTHEECVHVVADLGEVCRMPQVSPHVVAETDHAGVGWME